MPRNKAFHIGHVFVEPELDIIVDDGKETAIRPQVMDMLVFLAANQNRVVSNDEFLNEIWKGKVVTPSSVYSCLNELRRALGDDVHDPRFIQTVPRRGYKLIAPVRYSGAESEQSGALQAGSTIDNSLLSPNFLIALVVLIGIGIWASWRLILPLNQLPLEDTWGVPFHSVAVLPFVDLSESNDKAYLAAGLSEEIIHRLAQIPELQVTGRTSSFMFDPGQYDVAQIGKVLGVAHILEGSIRTDGEQIRVTAQLLRTKDQSHVWSKVYDRPFQSLISIQEEVSREIAVALSLSLSTSGEGLGQSRPPPPMTAHDLYLRALTLAHENTRKATLEAEVLLERALQLDPSYAEAHVLLAQFKFEEPYYLSGVSLTDSQLAAEEHLTRALELDPNLAHAYVVQGQLADVRGEGGEPYYRRALALNPNLAAAWHALAVDQYNRPGPWYKGIDAARKAVELDPLWMEAAQFLVMYLDMSPSFQNEARAIADRLYTQFPEHLDVLVMQSELRWSEGKITQAIDLIERARQVDIADKWVLEDIKIYWLVLGEFERAAQFPKYLYHWTEILTPGPAGRNDRLEKLAEKFDLGDDKRSGNLVLLPWTYMMTGNPEKVLDLYDPLLIDSELEIELEDSFWMGSSLRYSPALTLATVFHLLGDDRRAAVFLARVESVLEDRAGPRELLTHKMLQTQARVSALKGQSYNALQLLEQWVRTAPPDPRELLHPAYEPMRGSEHFARIVQLQLTVINRERTKLGLIPFEQLPWMEGQWSNHRSLASHKLRGSK